MRAACRLGSASAVGAPDPERAPDLHAHPARTQAPSPGPLLAAERRMSRALRLARIALESSGEVGLALVASLAALHFLWQKAREQRQ